jgi:hypothetical protein
VLIILCISVFNKVKGKFVYIKTMKITGLTGIISLKSQDNET